MVLGSKNFNKNYPMKKEFWIFTLNLRKIIGLHSIHKCVSFYSTTKFDTLSGHTESPILCKVIFH